MNQTIPHFPGKMKKASICALCNDSLQTIVYNLKTSSSSYSKAPLAEILESVGEVSFPLEDICESCYLLLNELDGLNIQVKEVTSKLKNYMDHAKKVFSTSANKIPELPRTEEWEDCEIQPESKHKLQNIQPPEQTMIIDNDSILSKCNVKHEQYLQDEVFEEPFVRTLSLSVIKSKFKKSSCAISNRMDKFKKDYSIPCSETSCITKVPNNCHKSRSKDAKPFICEICGHGYKQKYRFKIHMNMHNGINTFTCLYCNKSFTQKIGLLRHTAIHTGDYPYQCEECGKRFIHHTSFNLHKLTHNRVRHYKCSLCEMALMSSSHLKRHMRIHTGEKKFVCSYCGKSFAEKYNLAAHQKLHVIQKPDYSTKKNISCQICGESFWRKINLENHKMKKHFSVSTVLENVSL